MDNRPMHLLTLYNVKCRSGNPGEIGPDEPPWMEANIHFRCRYVAEFGPRFELKVSYQDAGREDVNLMMIENFIVRSTRPKVVLEFSKFNFVFQIKSLKYKGSVQVQSILANCKEIMASGIVHCDFSKHSSVFVANVPGSPALKPRSVLSRTGSRVVEWDSRPHGPFIQPFWKPSITPKSFNKGSRRGSVIRRTEKLSKSFYSERLERSVLLDTEEPVLEKEGLKNIFVKGLTKPPDVGSRPIKDSRKPSMGTGKKTIQQRLMELSESHRMTVVETEIPEKDFKAPVVCRTSGSRKLGNLVQSMQEGALNHAPKQIVSVESFKTRMQRKKGKEDRPVVVTSHGTKEDDLEMKKRPSLVQLTADLEGMYKRKFPCPADRMGKTLDEESSPIRVTVYNAPDEHYPYREDSPPPIKLAKFSESTTPRNGILPKESQSILNERINKNRKMPQSRITAYKVQDENYPQREDSPPPVKLARLSEKTQRPPVNDIPPDKSVSNGGFENLGNTCYMNAVLQSLFGLQTFHRGLLYLSFAKLSFFPESSILRALIQLMNGRFFPSSIKRGLLEDFKEAICYRNTEFTGSRQHDAHEFIRIFLDLLKVEIADITGERVKTRSSQHRSHCPVTSNFSFKVLQFLTCLRCENVVRKEEEWYDFPAALDSRMPSDQLETQKLVEKAFKDEEIEFNCRSCRGEKAYKKMLISELPRIMTIYIKRYVYDENGSIKKIHRKIAISKTISLSKFAVANVLQNESRTPHYNLACVVSHIGETPTSGHYIADVKMNGNWKCFDDSIVTDLQEDLVLKQREFTAYILFYHVDVPAGETY